MPARTRGSYLGCLTANRRSGHGWRMVTGGHNSSLIRSIFFHAKRSRCERRRSARCHIRSDRRTKPRMTRPRRRRPHGRATSGSDCGRCFWTFSSRTGRRCTGHWHSGIARRCPSLWTPRKGVPWPGVGRAGTSGDNAAATDTAHDTVRGSESSCVHFHGEPAVPHRLIHPPDAPAGIAAPAY